MTGAERIAAERQRQVDEEGHTAGQDAHHAEGELGWAGAVYALMAYSEDHQSQWWDEQDGCPEAWPWHPEAWNWSGDPIRNLERAGALIAAEIDRLLAVGGAP